MQHSAKISLSKTYVRQAIHLGGPNYHPPSEHPIEEVLP
jgi:hypothetical protein